MHQQIIDNIYEVLGTIGEAVEYLACNEDKQVFADVQYGRESIENLLETESGISVRKQIEADNLSDEDWLQEMYRVIDDIVHPLCVKNYYDQEFLKLISYLWNTDTKTMVRNMIDKLQVYRTISEQGYTDIVEYFSKYSFWGTLSPEEDDYTSFEWRAATLKQRSYEFLWMYKRMEDYLSKRTLYAILMNWAVLDSYQLNEIKSPFIDYYEPDIFPSNKEDVFVDVGAYTGDSIHNYVKMYGNAYSKIYAYEISESTCEILRKTTKDFHDVVIRQKGAGKETGVMSLAENTDASANKVEKTGVLSDEKVEIVTLDEELIDEGVTFIKMDIEGAEQDALLGCQRIIQTNHPKLAICTYHGYEDIWKIPSMIDAMNPDYKFYMRHYGGNLIPTEFVLLCKD